MCRRIELHQGVPPLSRRQHGVWLRPVRLRRIDLLPVPIRSERRCQPRTSQNRSSGATASIQRIETSPTIRTPRTPLGSFTRCTLSVHNVSRAIPALHLVCITVGWYDAGSDRKAYDKDPARLRQVSDLACTPTTRLPPCPKSAALHLVPAKAAVSEARLTHGCALVLLLRNRTDRRGRKRDSRLLKPRESSNLIVLCRPRPRSPGRWPCSARKTGSSPRKASEQGATPRSEPLCN